MTFKKNRDELNKVLTQNNINRDLILKYIPELIESTTCSQNHPAHIYNVFEHSVKVTEGVDNLLLLKISAILHDIGKPKTKVTIDGIEHFYGHPEISEKIAFEILTRFGYKKDFIEKVCRLIRYHDEKVIPDLENVKIAIDMIGYDLFEYWLNLKESDLKNHAPYYSEKYLPVLYKIKDIYLNDFKK